MAPAVTCTKVEGHDQCPRDYRTADPILEAATKASLVGGLIRFVGGYEEKDRTWSRTTRSFQIFKGLELGWCHAGGSNAAEVMHLLATQLPCVATYAWGAEGANMAQRSYCDSIVRAFAGRLDLPSGYEWLPAGWALISSRGDVQRLFSSWWYDQFVRPVVTWMQSKGYTQNVLLAFGVRARNSSHAQFDRLKKLCENDWAEGLSIFVDEYKGGKEAMVASWKIWTEVNFPPSLDDLEWPSDPDVDCSGATGSTSLLGMTSRPMAFVRENWKVLLGGAVVLGGGGIFYYLKTRKKRGKKGRKKG